MPKICFVLPTHWSRWSGGAEYQVRLLMDHLLATRPDWEFYYLCRYAVPDPLDPVRVVQVGKATLFGRFGRPLFMDGRQMLQQLRRIQPDLIYQRDAGAYTGIAARYCQESSCRMVWHVACEIDLLPFKPVFKKSLPFLWINHRLMAYGIRKSHAVIGQAHYQNTLLQQNYGRSCAAVIDNFHPVGESSCEKISDPLIVVWVANFKTVKRPELFVELARRFQKNTNVKFLMIGRVQKIVGGADVKVLAEGIVNLELTGELSQESVNGILDRADILVNTSLHEGFANTFIQAWLRLVPVLSLDVDPDQVLEREKIGFCTKTMERLVDKLQLLLDNVGLRQEMGQRARRYAIQNHSLANAEKIVAIMEQQLAHLSER
ncbi:MAG: glycosyltransferase family 4 protein [Magnetococcus sp. DMHC-6]